MKRITANILLLSFLLAGLVSATETPEILLIGNSYFNYNDQPAMLRALCDSADQPAIIGEYIRNGTNFLDHTRDQACLDKIASRQWDYVIGIDGARAVAYPESFPADMTYLSTLTLRNRTLEANDSGRFVFVMPWAFEDGMLWYNNWTDDFTRMQQKIYANSLSWANGQNYTVSPVGWAWAQVLDSLDYPLHYLHMFDWNHPTAKGSYLMACVLYCTVFRDTLHENPYRAGLPRAEAFWYQDLATEIVLSTPDLWYLPNLETALSLPLSFPSSLTLDCYPNPFNPSTVITMHYAVGSEAELRIYDLTGRLVDVLYQGYLKAGPHEFRWLADNVPAGVYVVRAQEGRDVRTKKIVYLP